MSVCFIFLNNIKHNENVIVCKKINIKLFLKVSLRISNKEADLIKPADALKSESSLKIQDLILIH